MRGEDHKKWVEEKRALFEIIENKAEKIRELISLNLYKQQKNRMQEKEINSLSLDYEDLEERFEVFKEVLEENYPVISQTISRIAKKVYEERALPPDCLLASADEVLEVRKATGVE